MTTLSPLGEQIASPPVTRSYTALSLNLALLPAVGLYLLFSLCVLWAARDIDIFRATPFLFWLMASLGIALLLAVLVLEPLLKRIRANSLAVVLLMLTLAAGGAWASKSWMLTTLADAVAAMPVAQKNSVLGLNKLLVDKKAPQLAKLFGVQPEAVEPGELMALKNVQLASGVLTPLKARPLKADREMKTLLMTVIYSAGLTIVVGGILILLNALAVILIVGRMLAALLPRQERTIRLASLGVTLIAGFILYHSIADKESVLTSSPHYQAFSNALAQQQGEEMAQLVTFAVHNQGILLPLAEQAAEKVNWQ